MKLHRIYEREIKSLQNQLVELTKVMSAGENQADVALAFINYIETNNSMWEYCLKEHIYDREVEKQNEKHEI